MTSWVFDEFAVFCVLFISLIKRIVCKCFVIKTNICCARSVIDHDCEVNGDYVSICLLLEVVNFLVRTAIALIALFVIFFCIWDDIAWFNKNKVLSCNSTFKLERNTLCRIVVFACCNAKVVE